MVNSDLTNCLAKHKIIFVIKFIMTALQSIGHKNKEPNHNGHLSPLTEIDSAAQKYENAASNRIPQELTLHGHKI